MNGNTSSSRFRAGRCICGELAGACACDTCGGGCDCTPCSCSGTTRCAADCNCEKCQREDTLT